VCCLAQSICAPHIPRPHPPSPPQRAPAGRGGVKSEGDGQLPVPHRPQLQALLAQVDLVLDGGRAVVLVGPDLLGLDGRVGLHGAAAGRALRMRDARRRACPSTHGGDAGLRVCSHAWAALRAHVRTRTQEHARTHRGELAGSTAVAKSGGGGKQLGRWVQVLVWLVPLRWWWVCRVHVCVRDHAQDARGRACKRPIALWVSRQPTWKPPPRAGGPKLYTVAGGYPLCCCCPCCPCCPPLLLLLLLWLWPIPPGAERGFLWLK